MKTFPGWILGGGGGNLYRDKRKGGVLRFFVRSFFGSCLLFFFCRLPRFEDSRAIQKGDEIVVFLNTH